MQLTHDQTTALRRALEEAIYYKAKCWDALLEAEDWVDGRCIVEDWLTDAAVQMPKPANINDVDDALLTALVDRILTDA